MTKEEILAMEADLDLDFQVDIKVMDGKGGYLACPAYSKDISVAWLVVEKMQEQGLAKTFTLYWGKGWWCFFEYYDLAGNPIYATRGKTVPEAICKAALLTKLGGKK